jgi:hypothetical protein
MHSVQGKSRMSATLGVPKEFLPAGGVAVRASYLLARQTPTHAPQLMHLARKRPSGSAPGGLIGPAASISGRGPESSDGYAPLAEGEASAKVAPTETKEVPKKVLREHFMEFLRV